MIVERRNLRGIAVDVNRLVCCSVAVVAVGLGLRMTGCCVSVYSMALTSLIFFSFSLPSDWPIFSPFICFIHSFSSFIAFSLSFQTFGSATTVVTAAQALPRCPNKDRLANIV